MINLKLRIKNKTTLTALVGTTIAFIYQVLGIVGVVPAISEDQITQLAGMAINILALLGIVIDPTTSGISDSKQAMGYSDVFKDGDE